MRITRRQRWAGAVLLAVSAGLSAVQTQDAHATLFDRLVAFFAPACATLAAAALHQEPKK